MRNILIFLISFLCADEGFRIYDESTDAGVREFYRKNHEYQTLDFVLQKKQQYLGLNHGKMTLWQAVELLDTIVDESDPDLDLPQSYHAYQTAEAMRKDGLPRRMILTGFIHDLGKVLLSFGEPQWAVVGDTFPVGCQFSEKIVFPAFFALNPDQFDQFGIYQPACGFDQLHMSWGHDEYLSHVVKDYLPPEAIYIIRYHSFYAAHREGDYAYFKNGHDEACFPWLLLFNKYDLYSKSEEKLDIEALKPFYEELIFEFFGDAILDW